MLAGVIGGVTGDGLVMAFEVLGKDIRIEDDFRHLEDRTRLARSPSFLICHLDHLIQQGGVGGAAKQAKALFKDAGVGPVRIRGAMPVEPCIKLRQLLGRQFSDGAFDVLYGIEIHGSPPSLSQYRI